MEDTDMTRSIINKTGRKKRSLAVMVALAAAFVLTGTSRSALASNVTCAPNQVEYPQRLMIQCAPTNYVGSLTAPSGCSGDNQTIDTLKMWMSLAEAAVLSGKRLTIYYDVCGGQNNVTDVVLLQ
jgi:hypothetical protein